LFKCTLRPRTEEEEEKVNIAGNKGKSKEGFCHDRARSFHPRLPPCTHGSDVVKLKKTEKVLTRQVNMFMKLFRSDDKFSQMLTQLESQPEVGGGSGSGGRGDDDQGDDEDDGEDGEDEDES
ncbi:hypothetical protein Tco_1454581, partial [Tanacetum coccineum]